MAVTETHGEVGKTTSRPRGDDHWDVVVVGHGAAGLTAALAYLEATPSGAAPRVAVLDRAPRSQRGGSTAWTTAAFRLTADAQLHPTWGEIVRATAGARANIAYIDAFYENATDTLNWIRRHGIALSSQAIPPLPMTYGKKSWFPVGGGRAIVDTLGDVIVERGATVFYQTTALRLVVGADSRLTGIIVRGSDGAERTMLADAVILASGGFEGNPEMLSRYIPNAHRLKTVAPGTEVNRGDGIRMAVEIGAASAGQFDGAHLEPVDPRSSNREALVRSWVYGIAVNSFGERFIDEAENPFDIQFDLLANRLFREHGGVGYAIIDAAIRSSVPMEYLNDAENPPVRADTIEELAERLGLPASTLAKTVREYNEAARGGTFDPSSLDGKSTAGLRINKSHWAVPLTTPPFEGVPVTVNICYTFGGLDTDGSARVLTTDGQPIPGLYAAGEIVGVFYEKYPSGSSVLRSLTFGRIAGQTAAAELAGARAGGERRPSDC